MTHTTGPWRVETTIPGPVFIVGPNNEHIADIFYITESGESKQANAYLIAAAPELLAVLRDIAHLVYHIQHYLPADYKEDSEKLYQWAQQTLARARAD